MDIAVIKRAMSGDPSAFEELYQYTHEKGFSVAYSVLHDPYEAEDILQDAYIKIYERIGSLQNPARFENWFYTLVKNRALDYLHLVKKDSNADLISAYEKVETPDFIFIDAIASDYRKFNPEANVDYTDVKKNIAKIIMGLPALQRACIMLRFKADMKIFEIAKQFNIPQSTVKSALDSSKEKIIAEMQTLEAQGVNLQSVTPILIIPFLRWMCGNNVPARLTAEAMAMSKSTSLASASSVLVSSSSRDTSGSVHNACSPIDSTTHTATETAKHVSATKSLPTTNNSTISNSSVGKSNRNNKTTKSSKKNTATENPAKPHESKRADKLKRKEEKRYKNKKKNNTEVIETVVYADYAQAKKAVKFAKINLIRIIIGMAFAIVATVYTFLALNGNSDYYAIACALSVPAYIIGGGIFKALKMAGKFGRIGWRIIPYFPMDLGIGLGTMIMSIMCFFFIPVVFVGMNFVQHKKDLDEAHRYLANCAATQMQLPSEE